MKFSTFSLIAAALLINAGSCLAATLFSDVPPGHPVYPALRRAVEAGILDGYGGPYFGNDPLNRFEAAIRIARILRNIDSMPAGRIQPRDVDRFHRLSQHFAEELALLGIHVRILQETSTDLGKEIESLKSTLDERSGKLGIRGLIQTRAAMSDSARNHFHGRGALAGVAAASTTPFAATVAGTPRGPATRVAATLPLSRNVPAATAGASASIIPEARFVFGLPQASLLMEGRLDEDLRLHLQLDIDGDSSAALVGGSAVGINEAYADLDRLARGSIRFRAGAWALPFQRERNPDMLPFHGEEQYGYRSLDLTLSPSFWDANWETVRNVGAGFWNGETARLQWHMAVTNTTSPGFNRDGSLLAWRQAAAAGVDMRNPFTGGSTTPRSLTLPNQRASVAGAADGAPLGVDVGRNLAAAGGFNLYGDALEGVDSNGGRPNEFGYYGWIGSRPGRNFRWDLGYFENGGNITPGPDEEGSVSEWRGFQANVGYTGLEGLRLMASYYDSVSDSETFGGTAAGGSRTPVGAARNFVGLGLFPLLTGATSTYPSVHSQSYSFLFASRLGSTDGLSLRYEDLEDRMGAASLAASIWTVGWNHDISNSALLQVEWTRPISESVTVAPGAGIGSLGAATRNESDVDDDSIQVSLKFSF